MHETTWKPKTIRTATPARCAVTQSRQNNAGSSTSYRSQCKFGIPMVPEISTERSKRIGTYSSTGTTHKAFNSSKRTTFVNFGRKSVVYRVFNRSLDIETRISGNSQSVWCSIPSVSCLEVFEQYGIKQSEAGTACPSKERRNHSAMEEISVAPYKKTLNGSMPTWSLLTKADFLSSLTSRGHGHSGEKHLFSITSTGKSGYQRLTPFRYLQKENVWLSTSACVPEILTVWMSGLSYSISSSIFTGTSLFFGIAGKFTRDWRLSNSLNVMPVYMLNGSHPMPQSIIRQNMSGTIMIPYFQMLSTRISKIFNIGCVFLCKKSKDLKIFYGHVSMLPIYHGSDNNLHYLCNIQ